MKNIIISTVILCIYTVIKTGVFMGMCAIIAATCMIALSIFYTNHNPFLFGDTLGAFITLIMVTMHEAENECD